MRKTVLKVFASVLAIVLLLSVIPVFSALASGTEIEQQLINAAANGGEVTVTEGVSLTQTIVVSKDLTINFKTYNEAEGYYQGMTLDLYGNPEAGGNAPGFIVAPGVKLTINGDSSSANMTYYHNNAFFELQANSTEAAEIVINQCTFYGSLLFKSTATGGDATPEITFNNGGVYTSGLFEGTVDLTVNSGWYSTDISEYVSSNSYLVEPSYQGGNYQVLILSTEFSDSFKKLLNSENKLVINRYDYAVDGNYDLFIDNLQSLLYKESTNDSYFVLNPQSETEKAENKALVSLYNNYTGEAEHHLLEYVFNYDPAIYDEAQTVLAALPKSDNPDEMYTYELVDLEMADFYLGSELGGSDWENVVNYSNAFKNAIGDKAYSVYLDIKMGGGDESIYSGIKIGGVGLLMYNGVAYGSQDMFVEGSTVMYVPADTADTDEAKIAALQTRLDRLYGEGKLKLHKTTLYDAYFWYLFTESYGSISGEYSNPDFESFKNGEYGGYYPALPDPEDPDYEELLTEFMVEISGDENATAEPSVLVLEANGLCHPIKIEKNANIIMPAESIAPEEPDEPVIPETPADKPTDEFVETETVVLVTKDVEAKLDYAEDVFPENTVVEIKQQKSGEIVKRVQQSLKAVAKEAVVFEITATSDGVKVQPNGKVTATFTLPEGFEPAKTVLYYVSTDGKYELIPITLSADGKTATAELTHFSTYVLAQTQDSPTTQSRGINIQLLLALAFISCAAAVVTVKKVKEN